MAYTYLIGWSHYNKFYYGVRYAKGCKPDDLFKTYFTSSKYVHNFIDQYGNPDIVQVRKIFESAEDARLWESKVLKRINAVSREDFINKTDNKSIAPEAALKGSFVKGYRHTDETKQLMSAMKLGKKRSKESRLKQSESVLGSKNHFYGKTHSNKTKSKLSEIKSIQQSGAGNSNAKKIMYAGKRYMMMKDLGHELGISNHFIRKMIKSGEVELV